MENDKGMLIELIGDRYASVKVHSLACTREEAATIARGKAVSRELAIREKPGIKLAPSSLYWLQPGEPLALLEGHVPVKQPRLGDEEDDFAGDEDDV